MRTSKKNKIFSTMSLWLGGFLFLASCSNLPTPTPASSIQSSESQGSESSSISSDETSYATSSEASEESPFATSSESQESEDTVSTPKTFHFYYINDFHGSVEINGYEAGLKNVFTFLKNKVDADPEHTIVLSGGDMWQGGYESNSNTGKMITEAMNAVPFDAMVLGNHDFDYGIEALEENMEIANFPMLGGNIVNYPSGSDWEKADASTILEKDGVKIGIIGNIGYGQTTSILSKNVSNLNFRDPEQYVISESAALKKAGCKLIINLLHDSQDNMTNWGCYKNLGSYLNGAFTAHTHQGEKEITNNVPILQAYCNGQDYSTMDFVVDGNQVTCEAYDNHTTQQGLTCDPAIATIYDKYVTGELKSHAAETLGTLTGSLTKDSVARVNTKALYETYKTQFPELALTMSNSQRAKLNAGTITYSSWYHATPFMNKIVFAKVTGSEIKNEAKYNLTYTGDLNSYSTLNNNSYYLIGVIDYLYYHMNVNKNYDYFKSAGTPSNLVAEIDAYPVDISASYIKNNLGGKIAANNFSNSATGFDIYK